MVPHLPLPICLGVLHPIQAFAGDHIHGTPPDEVTLDNQALLIVPWRRSIQYVKYRQVIEKRLPETCHKEGCVMQAIHNGLDEHKGCD
jgi:hypothetical protein